MHSNSSPAGAKTRLSRAKEDEILTRFDVDLSEAVTGCYQVHERAVKAHKHYTAYQQKSPTSQYSSDGYDAQFFGSLTAAVASEFAIITAAPYFLKFEARSAQGDSLADFYNASFDFHWHEDPRRLRKLQNLLIQRRLYGTVYPKIFWNEQWRSEGFFKEVESTVSVPMQNSFDGMPSVVEVPVKERKWVTERRKKKDSAAFDILNFFSCFPDTRQEELQDGRYFIHRQRRTAAYVREQGLMGSWYKSVVAELLENGSNGPQSGRGSAEYIESLNSMVGFSLDSPDGHGEIYEVFEYWFPEGSAVICNHRVVCYREGHLLGYYPLMHVRNYYVPGEHFGMSDYQVIERSLADFQNMHNTMLTNTYLNAFPPMVVGPGVDIKNMVYRPGGIIRTPGDPTSTVHQLSISNDAADNAARVKDALRVGMDNTLATSDTSRGALPTRTQSATAVAQASQSLSTRQAMQAAMLETEFIQPLGEGWRDMMSKLQSEPLSTKLRGGKDWITIQPLLENYDADLDCVPTAGSSKLNELEQKRLMEAMNIAANFKIPNVNLQEAFKVFVESLAPRLAERLIMTDQEAEKAMERQAMLRRLLEPPEAATSDAGPGPMATDNQIGSAPQDAAMNEAAQEMGTGQQL